MTESVPTAERLHQIISAAVEHRPDGFTLSSGAVSNHFIDGKRALSRGTDLAVAARHLVAVVRSAGVEFDAVGGLTLGADHLSHAVAIESGCEWFTIRKQPKGRGTNRVVEGCMLGPGSRVLLVDDVVTTGGSIVQAYERVIETGAGVVGAVTLVDRSGLADSHFARVGVPYLPLFTYADLGIPPVEAETSA